MQFGGRKSVAYSAIFAGAAQCYCALRTSPPLLRQLDELAEAVNHEGHFLAGFDRTVGGDLAGSDFADLRVPGGFKLGHKLTCGQAMGRREQRRDRQGANDHLDPSPHDSCSSARDNCWNLTTGKAKAQAETAGRAPVQPFAGGIAIDDEIPSRRTDEPKA